jgi:CRISPR-associated endonuclease Csn1
MRKILALDLGTSSIGWAVRQISENPSAHDIIEKGVVIFPEGFGRDKLNQFSLAAHRRVKRLTRRQYYRRKLRKYAVLNILIKHQMVPLSKSELREWIKPKNGQRAKYPTSAAFHNWLRLKPVGTSVEGPQFANIYELRKAGIKANLGIFEAEGYNEKYLLGRILYNYAQRRGFKSNSKVETDDTGKVKDAIGDLRKELNGRFLAEYFAEINPFEGRIRSRYIARDMYETEFSAVCDAYSGHLAPIRDELSQALFFVRPLKSQKSNVGHCTFEKGKARIHLSHPEFERFRLLQFLQNIRIKTGNGQEEEIPFEIIRGLIDKIERTVEDKFSKTQLQDWMVELIKAPVKIATDNKFPGSGCPVSYGLSKALGANWRTKSFQRTYPKHGKKNHVSQIDFLDIWHFLKEVDERPEKFKDDDPVRKYASELGMDESSADELAKIKIASGYASISLFAIRKISKWMEQGYPYHISVLIAGLERAIGQEEWPKVAQEVINDLAEYADDIPIASAVAKTYNHFLEAMKSEGIVAPETEIRDKFRYFLGGKEAKKMTGEATESAITQINVLLTEASRDLEQAVFKSSPNLMQFVQDRLRYELEVLGITSEADFEKAQGKLYHHSVIDKWKEPRVILDESIAGKEPHRILQLSTPYTGAIQNPAAMRALHEVRKLINFLLRKGTIDPNTSIAVEMARDLNDMNKRTAIRKWQEMRENERTRIKTFLSGVLQGAAPSEDQIKQANLWLEQIDSGDDKTDQAFLNKDYLGSDPRRKIPEEIITKIDLWHEQKGICLYSGKQLSISEVLFGDVQLEHTIPRSLCNDSTLENLTIASGSANRAKSNRIPSELTHGGPEVDDYETILLRIRPWKERIERLESLISKKNRSIRKLKISAPEKYNEAVVDRWLMKFEKYYWKGKVDRFEMAEVTPGFARRQLVDTQVITKYAVGWLRTVFTHVRGMKGSLTAELRKLWGLQGLYDTKDRTDHTHHLIDALVLCSISPGVYNRLTHYYRMVERQQRKAKLDEPWPDFRSDVAKLCESTLINHVFRDRTFVQTKRKLKKKGSEEPQRFQTGKGIKAQLHNETALGRVQAPQVGGLPKTVFTKRENIEKAKKPVFGKISEYVAQNKEAIKRGDFRMMPVYRLQTQNGQKISIDQLTTSQLKRLKDNDLNRFFLKDVQSKGLEKVQQDGFFTPLRKARIDTNTTNPIPVRKITEAFQNSGDEARHHMYYENAQNYALALYRNTDGKKEKRIYRVISYFELAAIGSSHNFPETVMEKGLEYFLETGFSGQQVFQIGKSVLLFENSVDEIWNDLSPTNLRHRLHKVDGIWNDGRITFLIHNESAIIQSPDGSARKGRPKGGTWKNDAENPIFLQVSKSNINAIIEGIDFKLEYDSTITRI